MRRNSTGADGRIDFVNGHEFVPTETLEIHEISTVGWPPLRKHYGRPFSLSDPQGEHVQVSWAAEEEPRYLMKKVRSDLWSTLRIMIKRWTAVCI